MWSSFFFFFFPNGDPVFKFRSQPCLNPNIQFLDTAGVNQRTCLSTPFCLPHGLVYSGAQDVRITHMKAIRGEHRSA